MTTALAIRDQSLQRVLYAAVQASTSGTAIDFTSIPSWVKEIDVVLDQVSLSGTDNILVQLGDSGGVETTGYKGCYLIMAASGTPGVFGSVLSTGAVVDMNGAGNIVSGTIRFTHMASNTWVIEGVLHKYVAGDTVVQLLTVGGYKTLSAVLDRVRVTRSGSNTFDAGSISLVGRG